MNLDIHLDAETLAGVIAARLTDALAAVQRQGRRPSVVLTGGTIAADAYRQIDRADVDWTDVDVYWGDERFVPAGHDDRNDREAREAFLTRLAVPDANVHPMPAHGCELSMAEAADSYAAALPTEPFDLVLLGVGPDGHVASLFPGFPQLDEQDRRVVEVFGSPKPPPERLTMTFATLCHARRVWFLAAGEGKADAVAAALADGPVNDIPARGVHGLDETSWLLDVAAARKVT